MNCNAQLTVQAGTPMIVEGESALPHRETEGVRARLAGFIFAKISPPEAPNPAALVAARVEHR